MARASPPPARCSLAWRKSRATRQPRNLENPVMVPDQPVLSAPVLATYLHWLALYPFFFLHYTLNSLLSPLTSPNLNSFPLPLNPTHLSQTFPLRSEGDSAETSPSFCRLRKLRLWMLQQDCCVTRLKWRILFVFHFKLMFCLSPTPRDIHVHAETEFEGTKWKWWRWNWIFDPPSKVSTLIKSPVETTLLRFWTNERTNK